MLTGPANLSPFSAATFERFANAGMLTNSSAKGWALQDNVPISGSQRYAYLRQLQRVASSQRVNGSPEVGLQTFVKR